VRYAAATLLELELKTGRTHQIRVHCTSMHHPIVGDAVYTYGRLGNRKRNGSPLENLLGSAERQMLHARHLGFTHPLDGRCMSFDAPLPKDMQQIMDALTAYAD
jgi:23S rRNA pseudouridine1911/1915/1917 synthase